MKHCAKCNTDKPSEAFAKDASRKDGRMYTCKECRAVYKKAYREQNSGKIAKYQNAYMTARRRAAGVKPRTKISHAERLEQKREYRKANREVINEKRRAYAKANPDKRRKWKHDVRKKLVQHRPVWADLAEIREFYEAARIIRGLGEDCVVDHIVPIGGATVCGLHCLDNLQIISSDENHAKHRRHWPDMP